MWILLHLLLLHSQPAACRAIYFPKTCRSTTNAPLLHVRTHRPLVVFSVLYLDDFSRLIAALTHIHAWSGAGVAKNGAPKNKMNIMLDLIPKVSRVRFQPWNPGYRRGLLTFMPSSWWCSRDGPHCGAWSVQIPFQQDLMWLPFCHTHRSRLLHCANRLVTLLEDLKYMTRCNNPKHEKHAHV